MRNRIMAHLVAFYPSQEHSLEVARALIDGGAEYLELQFPFSEPTADGPAIQRACAQALENGFTVNAGFGLLERIRRLSEVPIFVMSYANVAVRRGTAEFARRCAAAGARGIIVPDLPPDSDEGLYAAAKAEGLEAVPVVAPTISPQRVALVLAAGSSFLYAALRKGITGATTTIGEDNLSFLQRVSSSDVKVLAGFGISERRQVEALSPHVHAVVVGSAFIQAAGQDGTGGSPYETVLSTVRRLI